MIFAVTEKERVIDMRDRLIELLESTPTDFDGRRNVVTIAEHLIKNGVIVPPCNVGDTVYVIDLFDFEPCKKNGNNGDVCPHLYAEYGVGYECRKQRYGEKPFSCAEIKPVKIEDISEIFNYWNCFGKTVFLTREEAEQALKERMSDA